MTELQILKKLISLDSQVTKSNKNCRITKLKKGNLDLYNLVIHFPGVTSTNPLIFSGHTDTVPVSNRWTKNPFTPTVSQGKIFGLGSSDMKAGLAALITTALSIKEKPTRDIYFLFDADEEESCTGGYAFLKDIKIKSRTAQVIVAEPTGGDL
ncbi:MAG: M20/M25/M40 family metallo-hydrolase, partial [Candidatus Magasanikbacteria bacterium]|nr:M20/M25/M40 family metallo-hydrolase [Candidatus Magasanikbacteria bacterium]